MTGTNRMSQCVGDYQEWEPECALRPHVCCVWSNDLSRSTAEGYAVVPDGSADILWTEDRLWVAGPDTHPIQEKIGGRSHVLGVRFRPGSAYPWLGVPLSEIVNLRVPLEEFWGGEAQRAEDRLRALRYSGDLLPALQGTVVRRLERVGPADGQIACLRAHAVGAGGEGSSPLRQASFAIGISERTLLRRCNEAFGYGFKTLERILRFQRFLHLAVGSAPPNLAGLAQQAGFADQAHMTREVRRLSATTPGELVAQVSCQFGRFVQDG